MSLVKKAQVGRTAVQDDQLSPSQIQNAAQPGGTAIDDEAFQNAVLSQLKNIIFGSGSQNFWSALPTYVRPTDTTSTVQATLNGIAGNTLDAKTIVENRILRGVIVSTGNSFCTGVDPLLLKHSTSTDRTGIPVWDGADAGDFLATYVKIVQAATGSPILVQSGPHAGWLVVGRTRSGSSISPNSVEIEFRACEIGSDLSTSVAYTWEVGQPGTVDVMYGFRSRFDLFNETSLRVDLEAAVVTGSGSSVSATAVGQVLHSVNGSTFTARLPLTSSSLDRGGWLLNDSGYLLVIG